MAAGLWLALCAAGSASAPAQELVQVLNSTQDPTQQTGSQVEKTLVTVHGEVRDSATGRPLPRALVRAEGEADAGTLTDGVAGLRFRGLPSDRRPSGLSSRAFTIAHTQRKRLATRPRGPRTAFW